MHPSEFWFFMFAVVVAVSVGLGLARVINHPALTERLRWVVRRLKRIRLWHVMAVVAILALLMATADAPGLWLLFGGFAILVFAARAWIKEMVFLMTLHDEDFPGRFDKLVWAFLLTVLAPVGYWAFRRFRNAHWPELAVESENVQAFKVPAAPEMF
jgi:hypothetical protein